MSLLSRSSLRFSYQPQGHVTDIYTLTDLWCVIMYEPYSVLFIYTNDLACCLYKFQWFYFSERKKVDMLCLPCPLLVKFVIVYKVNIFLESVPLDGSAHWQCAFHIIMFIVIAFSIDIWNKLNAFLRQFYNKSFKHLPRKLFTLIFHKSSFLGY